MRWTARALALSLVLLVAACGSGKRVTTARVPTVPPPQPTQTETTQTNAATTTRTEEPTAAPAYRVYFLRNDKLVAVGRPGPQTPTPARAAMQQLLAGPTTREDGLGVTSAIAHGQRLTRLEIRNGVAIADFDPMVSPDSAALAQIVYTLTQFPTVRRVRTTRAVGSGTMTRASFEDYTPAILIESPLPNERVRSPLRVSGTANTFEATFAIDIRNSSNQTFTHQIVTATSGSGTRGTFDTTISFTASGSISLVAYEPSAENGQPLHTVRIPLTTD
jgi:hypothetical protein